MNQRIRNLEEEITSLLNSYNDIPIETKRLVLLHITSKAKEEADKAIIFEMSQAVSETGDLKDAEST